MGAQPARRLSAIQYAAPFIDFEFCCFHCEYFLTFRRFSFYVGSVWEVSLIIVFFASEAFLAFGFSLRMDDLSQA